MLKASLLPIGFVAFLVSTVLLTWVLVSVGVGHTAVLVIGSAYLLLPVALLVVARGQATQFSKPPLDYHPMFFLAFLLAGLGVLALRSHSSEDFTWLGLLVGSALLGIIGVGMRRNVKAYLRWLSEKERREHHGERHSH